MNINSRAKKIIKLAYVLDKEQNEVFKKNKPIVSFCDKHNIKINFI